MVLLTKPDNAQIVVNSDLIECIEETPDTVVTLTNGDKVAVVESMVEIIDKIVRYRRQISGLVEAGCERQLRRV